MYKGFVKGMWLYVARYTVPLVFKSPHISRDPLKEYPWEHLFFRALVLQAASRETNLNLQAKNLNGSDEEWMAKMFPKTLIRWPLYMYFFLFSVLTLHKQERQLLHRNLLPVDEHFWCQVWRMLLLYFQRYSLFSILPLKLQTSWRYDLTNLHSKKTSISLKRKKDIPKKKICLLFFLNLSNKQQ